MNIKLFIIGACVVVMSNLNSSSVEQAFLKKSLRNATTYQGENIPVVEVSSGVELGKLIALRFLEWVYDNPSGVIALPTGKSPEFFIKFLKFYKEHWEEKEVQDELTSYDIHSKEFPDTSQLKFVQLDEFFPIRPDWCNSFVYYVRTYYFPLFDIREENILTFDQFQDQDVEQICKLYEEKIKEWGGIGFFLGGIGPDGHIAFNMKGSSFDSVTRLVTLNYETAAASAISLGGIEFSRNKKALTIGLKTIMARPDATIIIIASGESKAKIIADAVQNEKTESIPASALQDHKGARFYLTRGAATCLVARQVEDLRKIEKIEDAFDVVDDVLSEIAIASNKTILSLTRDDLSESVKGVVLLEKTSGDIISFLEASTLRFVKKIENSLGEIKDKVVMHTEPHHDDIMLSYHPGAVRLLDNNENYFVSVTSGFRSVSNNFMIGMLRELSHETLMRLNCDIFNCTYNSILLEFAKAYECGDREALSELSLIIFARKCSDSFNKKTVDDLDVCMRELEKFYRETLGDSLRESEELSLLKGMMRETEVECLWALHGVPLDRIIHMRSHFYTNDYFGKSPTITDDAVPIFALIEKLKPGIITVALDPQGTGPDTHYKVLQVVADALRMNLDNYKDVRIWGYRNVWHRFSLGDATSMVPVSQKELDDLNDEFCTCFLTQKYASFPSHEYDGPFSHLSCKIQKEQLAKLKIILGQEFFDNHPNERVRTAAGMLLFKDMSVDQFLMQAEELRTLTEM
jgi:glucosamine-6-phosphate deaminase